MKEKKINIKVLNENATIPTYGSEFSAGADLYSNIEKDITIKPGETILIPTGVSFEIPTGLVGLVFARSSIATKEGLAPANKVGVIDSDYRGEIFVPIHNHSKGKGTITDKERIAQIIFMPYVKGNFNIVSDLSETKRGKGGFGSTGKK